jgi:hypothetical protein
MGDHHGRPPAPLIRPSNDDLMESFQINNNNNINNSARSGFIKMTRRQCVDVFLRRSKKCGYCSPDKPTFEEQCDNMDQKLLDNIIAK